MEKVAYYDFQGPNVYDYPASWYIVHGILIAAVIITVITIIYQIKRP